MVFCQNFPSTSVELGNTPAYSQKEKIVHFPQMGAGQLNLHDPWCSSLQSSLLMRFVLRQMVCIRDVSGSTREKGEDIQPSNTDVKNKNKKGTSFHPLTCCYPTFPLAARMGLTGPISSTSNLGEDSGVTCEGWIWPHLFSFYERNGTFRSFFSCFGLVLEFGDFSFSEKRKTWGGKCMTFSITWPLMYLFWLSVTLSTDRLPQSILKPPELFPLLTRGFTCRTKAVRFKDLILVGDRRDNHTTKHNMVQKSLSQHQPHQPCRQKVL